ncbi:MAG: type VI secretion system contractile sheath large subunit [bacterium]
MAAPKEKAAAAPAAAAAGTDLLTSVIAETNKAEASKELKALLDQALTSGVSPEDEKKKSIKNAIQLIENQIRNLDKALSSQLNLILHNPDFQALEATWRGMKYLVSKTETGSHLKLRALHATKSELLSDIENASDFDQSRLFKMIYEEEYGTYGGEPYGLLVSGYEFGKSNADLDLLMGLSNIAAAAHAPFIGSASSGLFGLDSFEKLGEPRDLAKLFEQNMEKWNQFRSMEDSRYVGLTLPRMLTRLPYGKATTPIEGFDFEEDVDGTDSSRYCWGAASWALGERITSAFAMHRWCAAIRGAEGGGMVEGLPLHKFKTAEGDIATKVPTEVAITDRREKELADLGFIPLVFCKGTNYATFFGAPTANKPKSYDTDFANANARISAQLPYILSASRFAHYLKVIARDKVGSFMTREEVSNFLNRWIMQYVIGADDAGQSLKAKYPLREARVDVYDVPGRPGAYRAVVYVRPHFQLDELTASIRLVANLPPPAA